MQIEVENLTKEKIDKDDLLNLSKYIVDRLKIKNPIFNIIIVDNEEIRRINKEYRKIDKETDVISFALEENSDIIYKEFRLLGDIYISIDKAKDQASSYGHSLRRELCFLTTHGILHLLGYDHVDNPEGEAIMIKKQKEILEEEDRKIMRELEESVLNGYDVKRGT